jgi:hypothetical protein
MPVCLSKMALAQQNGFGSTFSHMMLRLVKSLEEPNTGCFNWLDSLIGSGGLVVVVVVSSPVS